MNDEAKPAPSVVPGTISFVQHGVTYHVPVLDATGKIGAQFIPGPVVPPPAPPSKTEVGMFAEASGSVTQTAAVAALAVKLGVTPTVAGSYTDATSWATIAGYHAWFGAANPNLYRLLLGLNIPGGAHDTDVPANLGTYKTLAQNLVADGCSDAVIRFLWEMNNAGANTKSVTSAAAFKAAFNGVHDTMQAVPGAKFTFEFCINAGQGFVDGSSFAAGIDLWIPETATRIGDDYYMNPLYDTEDSVVGNIVWAGQYADAHGLEWSLSEFGSGDDAHANFFGWALSAVYGHQGCSPAACHAIWQSGGDDVTTPNNAAAYKAGVLAR